MSEIGRYDAEMQQFVEAPKELIQPKLEFHKFLADRGDYTADMQADTVKLADVRKELSEIGQH